MIKETTRIQNFYKREGWIDNMIIQSLGERYKRVLTVKFNFAVCLKFHNKMLGKIIVIKKQVV